MLKTWQSCLQMCSYIMVIILPVFLIPWLYTLWQLPSAMILHISDHISKVSINWDISPSYHLTRLATNDDLISCWYMIKISLNGDLLPFDHFTKIFLNGDLTSCWSHLRSFFKLYRYCWLYNQSYGNLTPCSSLEQSFL